MTGRVDAAHTQALVREWYRQGWSTQAIADASGVSRPTVTNLLRAALPRCYTTTRDAIAGLTRPLLHRHAVMVPATATTRRVQHLQWCGWPQTVIAEEVGIAQHSVSNLAQGVNLTVTTYLERKVERVFDRMWRRDGGDIRSKKHARRQGWLPVTVWDDINDPYAVPQEVAA